MPAGVFPIPENATILNAHSGNTQRIMSKKILVGESNYAEFEVLNDLLTAKGFKVVWMKNGRDVLSQFDEISPDLMILDALLPGMTGLKITQAIKSTPGRNVKIILMSSVYKQFKEQYEARSKVGVDAYTEKPVNVGELERLITDLIGVNGKTAEIGPEAAPTAPEQRDDEQATDESSVTSTVDAKRKIGVDGDISETSFPKLLFYLHKYERTGALRVDREQVSKNIYFQSGFPVLVTSNQSTESLGRFLVQRKLITAAQYNASLEKMLESGKQHGEVLLEMNAITPHDLYRALYDHIAEKVLTVFSWDYGRYRFKAGRFEVNQNFTINIDPIQLIYQGVKRYFPLSRLEGFFNDYKNRRLIRVADAIVSDRSIGVGPAEMKFITLINDKRTVGQIVSRSNLSLSETFQILYLLLLVETIRFKGDPFFGESGMKAGTEFSRERRGRRRVLRNVPDSEMTGSRILDNFQKEIHRAYEKSENLNHYQILSIPRNADLNQIKNAYFILSSRFHDHNLYSQADEITKRKADELFQILTSAYATLINPETRKQYDHDLSVSAIENLPSDVPDVGPESFEEPELPPLEKTPEPPKPKPAFSLFDDLEAPDALASEPQATEALAGLDSLWDADSGLEKDHADEEALGLDPASPAAQDDESVEVTSDMAHLLKAELAFQEGEDALHDSAFEHAEKAFRKALEIAPNEAEYHAYLGWAVFRNNSDDPAKIQSAIASIEKGISMNPTMDSGHYFLGMILWHQGDKAKAVTLLDKALQCNPDYYPAAEAKRKLEEA
jgi:DNA-binding response OmpR family regulator/tetratricopeptide (TPR) repeat protein